MRSPWRMTTVRGVPDLWFFAGLAMGISLAGFAGVGSFGRGVDDARRRAWSHEMSLRQRDH